MAWHIIEKLLEEVAKHSTFVGKVWITAIFLFRIVVVTRICDTVYHDEQAAFRCNIKQPGCENVCFNDFSPISHVRFWGFQIIAVALPSILFIVYAAHEVGRKVSRPTGNQKLGTPIRNSSIFKEKPKNTKEYFKRFLKFLFAKKRAKRTLAQRKKSQVSEEGHESEIKQIELNLCRGYIFQSVVRCIVEIFFAFLQFRLFGFDVPEVVKCDLDPCPNSVDCYISRPKEKRILLVFMFCICLLCILLNLLEIGTFISYRDDDEQKPNLKDFGVGDSAKQHKMYAKSFLHPEDATNHQESDEEEYRRRIDLVHSDNYI
ncbi:unnamed protein product [Oikopleura dioica]|uniref:Gap junction protein n=1 Tax=Oikopleura dioica TaxID=34765 RepID=E4YXE3_OIKDI|nr:unnamed protein product [Oikopleura dioica]